MGDRRTIELKAAPAFLGLYRPARYKVFYGGRGGRKSWEFAQALLARTYTGKLRVLCARELQNSISDSVHKLLSDRIRALGLYPYFKITQNAITSFTGSEFAFKGLRANKEELKSMEGVDICWVEEAVDVSAESWDILLPTIRKAHSEIWISFNPNEETDETYQRFVAHPRPDSLIKKVTWRDNPDFPEVLRQEMNFDRANDYDRYRHVWEGDFRKGGGDVFRREWWSFYHERPPDFDSVKVFVDTAMKKGQKNDFTVFQLWGRRRDSIYLLEQWRAQVEAPELYEMADRIYAEARLFAAFHGLMVEDKVSGTGLVQVMKRRGQRVKGLQRGPRDGKVERANLAAPYIKAGSVYLPRRAPWLEAYLKEFDQFRSDMSHAHDDQVDPTCDAIKDFLIEGRSGPALVSGGFKRGFDRFAFDRRPEFGA